MEYEQLYSTNKSNYTSLFNIYVNQIAGYKTKCSKQNKTCSEILGIIPKVDIFGKKNVKKYNIGFINLYESAFKNDFKKINDQPLNHSELILHIHQRENETFNDHDVLVKLSKRNGLTLKDVIKEYFKRFVQMRNKVFGPNSEHAVGAEFALDTVYLYKKHVYFTYST